MLGAELDGVAGTVGAPRARIIALVALTLRVCRLGRISPSGFSSLLGCWVHVLLFRRPLLCVFSAVFRVPACDDELLVLSPAVLDELLLICLLAPTAYTNLRASTLSSVFAVDASTFGAGACAAFVGPELGGELFRHVESRGFYTRLACRAACALSRFTGDLDLERTLGRGALALGAEPPGPRDASSWDALLLGLGAADVLSTKRMEGLTVYEGRFASADGSIEDLKRPSVFRLLGGLASRRAV